VSLTPHGNPYRIYREQQVTGLGTGRLVLLALETALRACAQGRRGLLTSVLTELMAGLDLDSGEIAAGLLSLYGYMLRRVREGELAEVQGMLQELRDAWEQAVRAEERKGPDRAAASGEPIQVT